jgi:hypothetical protein
MQHAFLGIFLERLDLIAHFKCVPVLKAHSAFRAFAHFRDILLDVLERVERAWNVVS